MSQREPGLQEVLNAQFDYLMGGIYTSIPGIVVSVSHLGENRIVVQPSLNMVTKDLMEVTERPVSINVPFHQPQTKQGGLSIPIQTGDPVFLIFSMRGLDSWKSGNGYPVTPTDRRKFDARDCMAIPGVFPFSQSPNRPDRHTLSHDPNDVVLVHNLGTGVEVEVRLKAGGGLQINAPGQTVEVNCENSQVVATKKVSYSAMDYEITCTNYKLTTGNYQVDVEAGGSNVSNGNFRMNGSFILNSIPMEGHRHQETGSITNGPQV